MEGFSNVQSTMVVFVDPGQTSIGSGSSHVITMDGNTWFCAEESGPNDISTINETIIVHNAVLRTTVLTHNSNG